MKLTKFILIAFTLLFAAHAQAVTQTIKAEVNGMVCAFCAQGIEKKMRSLSQTKDVYVNLQQRIVAVELKEGQALTHDKVKDLIKDAGYDVSQIVTVDQSVEQIKSGLEVKK